MTPPLLFKNIAALITGDINTPILRHVDMLVEGPAISNIGPGLASQPLPPNTDIIDASDYFIYPGLVNTHHHFFQAFMRNYSTLSWPDLGVIEWLKLIYPVFALYTEDCIYHSSLVSMAELIKHGCTTAFDHQYLFPRHAGPYLVDRQFEAAQKLGMRFHAGRGTNTLPISEGSTIPDAMLETTDEFIQDCERLFTAYHDPELFSMRQLVVAPCQPCNSYRETFSEAIALARNKGLCFHSHLGEGENSLIQQRYGMRSLAWCEDLNILGPDVWFAHGWEFNDDEIALLAQTGTGVSHCPAPVFLVGEGVTRVSKMVEQGVPLGLGVDGQASNDNSNLMECIRQAYQLQCLVASEHPEPVPAPAEFLAMASQGGAALLNRSDLGKLAPGYAADFFAINTNKLELVGTLHDPLALPVKVGLGAPVDITVINGRIVWRDGEFPGIDEQQLVRDAQAVLQDVIYQSEEVKQLLV